VKSVNGLVLLTEEEEALQSMFDWQTEIGRGYGKETNVKNLK
jgi:hypothetical protein